MMHLYDSPDMILNPYRHAAAGGDTPFEFTWKTDNVGTSTSVQATIPTVSGASYDCVVDWGDSSTSTITTWDDAAWTHTYSSADTYTISISGDFGRIYFNNGGDRLKLITIETIGDVGWESMRGAFFGCENMTIDAASTGDTSTIADWTDAFERCLVMTDFPIDMSGAVDCNSTFRTCNSLVLPSGFGLMFGGMTDGASFFRSASISTADRSQFVIDLETVNSNIGVSLQLGSPVTTDGQDAIDALEGSPRFWNIY